MPLWSVKDRPRYPTGEPRVSVPANTDNRSGPRALIAQIRSRPNRAPVAVTLGSARLGPGGAGAVVAAHAGLLHVEDGPADRVGLGGDRRMCGLFRATAAGSAYSGPVQRPLRGTQAVQGAPDAGHGQCYPEAGLDRLLAEPARSTSAQERRSDKKAWSAMVVALTARSPEGRRWCRVVPPRRRSVTRAPRCRANAGRVRGRSPWPRDGKGRGGGPARPGPAGGRRRW
jgi:hypothetical protein